MSGKHAAPYVLGSEPSLEQQVRDIIKNEMSHYLTDIEFRLKQTYDIANRGREGHEGQVYAEDLNLTRHMLTGYTLSPNSQISGGTLSTLSGSIAWQSLHVVYNGSDYAIPDGSTGTANKFVWWDPDVGGTNASTTVVQQAATKPDLSGKPRAALLFVNNGGTPFDNMAASIPGVLQNNTVDAGAVQQGAITAPKMNTIQHLLY